MTLTTENFHKVKDMCDNVICRVINLSYMLGTIVYFNICDDNYTTNELNLCQLLLNVSF